MIDPRENPDEREPNTISAVREPNTRTEEQQTADNAEGAAADREPNTIDGASTDN